MVNQDLEKRIKELENEKKRLEERNKELEEKIGLDPQTKFYNYGVIYEQLYEKLMNEFDIMNTEDEKIELSVILIDFDKFKKGNDTYGHPKMDYVVKEATKRMSAVLRERGTIKTRSKGDEFYIMLIGVGDEIADSIKERVRKAIEDEPYVFNRNNPDEQYNLKASFGLTSREIKVEEIKRRFNKIFDNYSKSIIDNRRNTQKIREIKEQRKMELISVLEEYLSPVFIDVDKRMYANKKSKEANGKNAYKFTTA